MIYINIFSYTLLLNGVYEPHLLTPFNFSKYLIGATVHVLKSKAQDAIDEIEKFTNEVLSFLNITDHILRRDLNHLREKGYLRLEGKGMFDG